MRHVLREQGLEGVVEVDSAGTGAWHVGNGPDVRSAAAALVRGIRLDGAARQVAAGDFTVFDMVLAADGDNRRALLALAADDPARSRVRMLREFDAEAAGNLDVPDPYYGGEDGFEDVLDIVERSCRGLLEHLRAEGRV